MTELRAIGALDLPNLTPADLSGRALPMLEWLDVDELWVDPAYQRDLSPAALRMIAQLVEGWDWLKCAPLLVALTDRGLEVIDGQNRATAGKLHPQIEALPAYVVDGSTLPQRADAFVAHARDRVAVTPGQIHRAAVTAGDADALALHSACRDAGVRILPFSPPFGVPYQIGDTTALASIRAMLGRRGPDRSVVVLRALVAAGLAPITAQHLRAAEALCCEPEYAAEFGPEQLTAALLALGPGLAGEVRALAAAKGLPAWRAMVAVLFKHRGRRAKPFESTTPPPPAATDPTPVRAPGKGDYRAPDTRAKALGGDHDSTAPIAPRRAVPVTAAIMGDPPAGRSALDQRRSGT